MNPLAKPLFKVLAAIQDDPKYAELARELHDEYVAHAHQLASDKPMNERLAPIITQCRIMGLSEEEFEALEKEASKRYPGLKKRRALEQQKAQMASMFDMKKHQLDAYKAMLDIEMSKASLGAIVPMPESPKLTLLDKLKGKK